MWWSIVCFTDDNSVDFIPNFGLKKKYCSWPIKKTNVRSFIEKRIDPETVPNEFTLYKARLSFNNISDINVARSKAKKAQYTSDLSSHTETDDPLSSQNRTVKPIKNKAPSPPLFTSDVKLEEDEVREIVEVYNTSQVEHNSFDQHESSQILYEYSDTNSYETNNKKRKLNTSSSTTSLSPAVEAKEYSENILEKQLKESIRQMKPFSAAPNVEIEKPLNNWMAQASNRINKATEKEVLTSETNRI